MGDIGFDKDVFKLEKRSKSSLKKRTLSMDDMKKPLRIDATIIDKEECI